MKIALPERSIVIKDKLNSIVKEILAVAEQKISMIILFGSYARGDWVQDKYIRGHGTYTYESDIDLLLVLKKRKYAGHRTIELQHKIRKRLESKELTFGGLIGELEPSVTLVLESINFINEKLEKGHYFFTDIKKDGILLYDSYEFNLSEAKELPDVERKEIAKKDYKQWFNRGVEFLIDTYSALQRGNYNLSTFYLHQVTESFYNTILLVFSGYKPKLHDILKLAKIARSYNQELFGVFPYETQEQRKCFELLMQAYIDARYNEDYKITKEQLSYLIERVEHLKNLTEKICLEWIDRNNFQATNPSFMIYKN